MVGPHIEDACHGAEAVDDRVRKFVQVRRVRVRQHSLHGAAEIDDLPAKAIPRT